MKKLIFTIAFAVGVFALSNAQKLDIKNYSENTVDYGTVEKGSDGSRTIKFVNSGNKPLIINNISSSCGCTVPSWTKEPIAPGKEGEIKVTYNTNISGGINRQITVSSNDATSQNLVIRIRGAVVGG